MTRFGLWFLCGAFAALSGVPAMAGNEGAAAAAPPSTEAAPAATAPEATAPAEVAPLTLEARLAAADGLYAEREVGFKGPKIDGAIKALEEADKAHPGSYEVLWRLSRAYWWKADGAPNGKVKGIWGQKAWTAGDKARALAKGDVKGHYFAALGVGATSQGMGILTALTKGMEGKFNERLDRSIALDAGFDCGGPMSTKGRYFFELPWPKYDADESVSWFKKATAACPTNVRVWAYLAEVLMKEGKKAEAKAAIAKALALDPAKDVDPPEARRGRKLATALSKKK